MSDASCRAKIILDGGNAANFIEQTCEMLTFCFSNGVEISEEDELALIKQTIVLEEGGLKLQKMALKAIGYPKDFPLPRFIAQAGG